jgi:hypothetical protein
MLEHSPIEYTRQYKYHQSAASRSDNAECLSQILERQGDGQGHQQIACLYAVRIILKYHNEDSIRDSKDAQQGFKSTHY